MFDVDIRETFMLIIVATAVPLLLGSVCGLIVSIIQAATQLQEQTTTYLVKFLAIVASIVVGGRWLTSEIIEFFQKILTSIQYLGKM